MGKSQSLCPEHGDLGRRFLLGLLPDEEATAVETELVQCAFCRSLLTESSVPGAVFAGVVAGLASFRPPGTAVRQSLLPLAAGIVLGIGAVLSWSSFQPEGGEEMAAHTHEIAGPPATAAEAARSSTDAGVLFADGLEKGDLSAWTAYDRALDSHRPAAPSL